MDQAKKINDNVTVGPQPAPEEIGQLSDQGFATVINFRESGEEEQPISPQEEAQRAQSAGMEYFHLPVSAESLDADQVDRFRNQFQQLPKPVFAHCKSGKRAGAMVMMHLSCEKGMTGQQTIEQANEMGFECDQPELVEFVKTYVDEHRSQSS